MPVIRSAKKALRQSKRRKVFNAARTRVMKDSVKEVRSLVASGKRDAAEKLLSASFAAIDKAAKRGVINQNAAARKKSRLVALLRRTK